MSENDAKKNKHRFKDIEKTSRESNEQQVLTVAAFCFAIVSWMATARGLQAYVFSGGAEATLISFGVQSILFVFNLRLPFLIEKGDLPFANGDYIFLPDVRKAVETKAAEFEAYVVKDGSLTPFALKMGELTDDEREIILKGCLINYYRG